MSDERSIFHISFDIFQFPFAIHMALKSSDQEFATSIANDPLAWSTNVN